MKNLLILFLPFLFISCAINPHGSNLNNNIKVSISQQCLTVVNSTNNQIVEKFPVSTSKYGIGFSNKKTPLGNFQIIDKIGSGSPLYQNFKARKPVNYKTGIITRILQLKGLDKSNKNTARRKVYIHGTYHNVSAGPQSIGCITLYPKDMIKLFDLVEINSKIEVIK